FRITELRSVYNQLGVARFWILVASTLIYIAIGSALSIYATWPGICDHSGRKIVGFIKQFYCSPDLLSGGVVELGLFAWLWSMPIIGVIGVAWSWIQHFRRKDV
ncbi:MAG: hypothetical protein KJ834_00935, partial [Alphaproteobacteria bacterium]|nr:hypothetical protein [Alphaproteobacteria bacterium]